MVSRQWLLLSAIGSLGCDAEHLNIPLPKRGRASIHQEDLKRGLWQIEQGQNPVQWWQKKMATLSLEQSRDNCVSTDPHLEAMTTIWAKNSENPLQVDVVSLFALAKSADFVQLPNPLEFCFWQNGIPIDEAALSIQFLQIHNVLSEDFHCEVGFCGSRHPFEGEFTEIHFVNWVTHLQTVATQLNVPATRSSAP